MLNILRISQTIFCSVEDTYEYNIVGWVSEKGLEELDLLNR